MDFRTIIFLFFLIFLSCSTDKVVKSQKDNIEKYLEGRDAEFDIIDGVYRYVVNSDREDRSVEPVAEKGDSVFYRFDLRILNGISGPGTDIYYTNWPETIDNMEYYGLTPTEFWSKELARARIGSTDLTVGLRVGLSDAAQGDSIYVFVPSDKAGKNKAWGLFPKETPLVWILSVKEVKKDNQ